MNLGIGLFRTLAVDKAFRKKFIAGCVGMAVFIAITIAVIAAAYSYSKAVNPNKLDLDFIKPDGSLNEKEIFRDIIEDRNRRQNRYYKETF